MNAIIAILIAAFSFSFFPLLNSIAMDYFPKYFLALMIQIITTFLSFGLLVLQLKSLKKAIEITYLFWKLPWDLKIIPFLSGTGIFMGGLFFIFSLDLMNKTGATLIMECWPILAIVITRALLTHKEWESFKLIDVLLIIMTLIGLVLITASETGLRLNEFFLNPISILIEGEISELLSILFAVLAALCYAWSGVSRSYFSSRLPEKFRMHYFSKKDSLSESNFTYMLTYMLGLPFAVTVYYYFEVSIEPVNFKMMPLLFLLGASLVITSMYYSYALLVAKNANVNLIWYIAPVLATLWLIMFGYSALTPLIILGGLLIICANLILLIISKEKKATKNEHANTA